MAEETDDYGHKAPVDLLMAADMVEKGFNPIGYKKKSRKPPLSLAELDEEKEPKEIYKQVPTLITNQFIAEQVWDRHGSPQFAIRYFKNEEIQYVNNLFLGEYDKSGKAVIYEPVDDAALRLGQVIVPQSADPTTFADVFKEGVDLALDLYDCETTKLPEFKLMVAIGQASWFLDRFSPDKRFQIAGMGKFAPIIPFRGPSGSGKNRALSAIRINSYRPYYDQSTRKIPSIFRPMDTWRGSLFLDEADFQKGDESSEATRYLNTRSYGTPISRQNPNNVKESQVFANFGLTVVTQRRVWDDDATENRSLPFSCERSQKDLATTELQEWIERAMTLQNHLLWLRLRYWPKIVINNAARVKGVKDHRLTAAVLPLLALEPFAPDMVSDLKDVLLKLEKKRREARAMSKDGIIINYLWDKIEDDLVGVWENIHYVGTQKISEKDGEKIVPLQIKEFEEHFSMGGKETRRTIHSLQLVRDGLTLPKTSVRLGSGKYRPIFFSPEKLEVRLRDFVIDYEDNEVGKHIQKTTYFTSLDDYFTDDTGTHGTHGTLKQYVSLSKSDNRRGSEAPSANTNGPETPHTGGASVPSVPSVPDKFLFACSCGRMDGISGPNDKAWAGHKALKWPEGTIHELKPMEKTTEFDAFWGGTQP